jgi:hypothetical protein
VAVNHQFTQLIVNNAKYDVKDAKKKVTEQMKRFNKLDWFKKFCYFSPISPL